MKTLEQKIEDFAWEHTDERFSQNEDGRVSHAHAVIDGANFAIPLAKEEGFRLAIAVLNEEEGNLDFKFATILKYRGIQLGILTDSGDKE